VVDSPLLIVDALESGADVEAVWVEVGSHDDVVAAASARGVAVHPVPAGAVRRFKATDLVTPQGAVAVVRSRPVAFDAVTSPLIVVLAGVADPGNAGTIVRSAEAAGAGAVVFCDGTVDPWNPKCVRASAGSVLHVDVVPAGPAVAVLRTVGARGWRRVAAVPRDGVSPEATDLRDRIAVVVGGEAHGLSADAVGECDTLVSIPMAGRVESLNAATAATLVLFESARQRRAAAGS
jgi:TrmH family RNA methyltransferase